MKEFGAPSDNLKDDDFAQKGTLYVFGIALNRVDIFTGVSGLNFDKAWKNRVLVKQKNIKTPFCLKQDLIKMKTAAGRVQDLLDLEALGVTKTKSRKKSSANR